MSSSDISLPSPSPSPSRDPYAFASSHEISAAPQAKKKRKQWGSPLPEPWNWPAADELAILEAVADHKEHYSADQRVSSLRQRYDISVTRLRRGTVPVNDDDVRLSKRIWEGAHKRGRRAFEEMKGMYPFLATVVEEIDAGSGAHPGFMKGAFQRMGGEQAAQLEAKVRKQRIAELKTSVRRAEVKSLVTQAILDEME